jgi:K+-sensing histidine kinase KdpD
LVAVGIVVGEIAARRRKAQSQGRLAREEVIGLYVVSQMLSAGVRLRMVIDAVGEQLEAPTIAHIVAVRALAVGRRRPRDQPGR